MTKFLRTTLVATAAAVALTATPAFAVGPAQNATGTARIVKPLTLQWQQDLDLGTIILNFPRAWTGATVSITPTGTFNCDGGSEHEGDLHQRDQAGAVQGDGHEQPGRDDHAPERDSHRPQRNSADDGVETGQSGGTVNLGNSGAAGLTRPRRRSRSIRRPRTAPIPARSTSRSITKL